MPSDDERQPLAEHNSIGAGRSHVLNHLVGFVTDLRARGADVPTNAAVGGAQALAVVGLSDRDAARIALRAALIADHKHLATFDALFPEFWRAIQGESEPDSWTPPEQTGMPSAHQQDRDSLFSRSPVEGDWTTVGEEEIISTDPDSRISESGVSKTAIPRVSRAVYSPMGSSRPISQRYAGETIGMRAAVRSLGAAIAMQPGRRWSRDGTDRIDARKALRRGINTGGLVATLPRLSRRRTKARAVLLVDVSQSVIDTIDRSVLIEFLAIAHEEWSQLRTFFFDTDVREVTDVFDNGVDAARALEQAEAEWGGGTRIGHAIETVCQTSPVVIDRDTVTLIISDGLEVGEIEQLEGAMATLNHRGRSVLWLNPLANSPTFEPTCRGMAVSLPFLDGLFAFTEPDDLVEIAEQLLVRGLGGSLGYEYDRIR